MSGTAQLGDLQLGDAQLGEADVTTTVAPQPWTPWPQLAPIMAQ